MSAFSDSTNIAPDVTALTREEAQALGQKILHYSPSADAFAMTESTTYGSTEFSRNQIDAGEDDQSRRVAVTSIHGKKTAAVFTNALDDDSLAEAANKADALARRESVSMAAQFDPPLPPGPVNPALWSESAVDNVDAANRYKILKQAIDSVKDADLIGAGNLAVSAQTMAVITKGGHFEYGRTSTSTYSLTVRTKDGTGSGWAGWKGEDWNRVNPQAMVLKAIDVAQRTRNPVAIEPGRYTVVMSPAALGGLVYKIAADDLSLAAADEGDSPFSKRGGGNKIGLKVFDERVTMLADPMDSDGGFLPFSYQDGAILQVEKITWVEHGILKELASANREYAERRGHRTLLNSLALRMEGGNTSIDEMIASTQRGVFVTRFANVSILNHRTFLMTGVTRDGTFLIENGKITRPLKNFRFVDSPFFFLNNLESLGPTERVPVGVRPYVMPSAKVRDFSFTSLSDAV